MRDDAMKEPPRLGDLVTNWRDRAKGLEPYAPAAATAYLMAADELERDLAASEDALLTLETAASESGYTADHLGRLLAAGRLRNHGRKHAPRVRRGDLPRKPPETPSPRLEQIAHAARQSRPGRAKSA